MFVRILHQLNECIVELRESLLESLVVLPDLADLLEIDLGCDRGLLVRLVD